MWEWGYSPLGSREYRASGLGSLCRTGRSQGFSAPVRPGEESTRDCEAGEEQHQLPPLWCLRRGVKCLPQLWCKESSGDRAGPELPRARLCRDTGGGCRGEVTLTAGRGHWAAEDHGGPPLPPPGELGTLPAVCSVHGTGVGTVHSRVDTPLQGEEQPLRTLLFANTRPVRLSAAL